MKTVKTLSWIVVALGAWEVLAPFILGYSATGAALWDAIIIGIALIILAAWAALSNVETTIKALEWIDVALGVWLIIAPFILGYSGVAAALWNDIIIGLSAGVLSLWAALAVGSSAGQHMGMGQTA